MLRVTLLAASTAAMRLQVTPLRWAVGSMPIVNMFEAKSTLSRLVSDVEEGRVDEVIIARNGRPAARIVPPDPRTTGARIGVACGVFTVGDTIDAHDDEIAALFQGDRE